MAVTERMDVSGSLTKTSNVFAAAGLNDVDEERGDIEAFFLLLVRNIVLLLLVFSNLYNRFFTDYSTREDDNTEILVVALMVMSRTLLSVRPCLI